MKKEIMDREHKHLREEKKSVPKKDKNEIEEEDGIEKEPEVIEEFPFDAEKIAVDMRLVPMTRLVERLQKQTISIPEIQRNENLWGPDKQSRLMESLMLKIPLPLFYVAADADENWKIIDGLQRMSTIRNFMIGQNSNKGKAKLEQLEFLTEYNTKTIDDLPDKYQNRIKDTEFQFAVISATTPPEVQRAIFKRLNTGGLFLSAQEIRHALYYHKNTASLLKEMVESDEFKEATDNSIDDSRMAGQELVLRFIAFLIRKEAYKKDDIMDNFLSETMILLNVMPDFNDTAIRKYIYKKNDEFLKKCKYNDFNEIKGKFFIAMKRAYKLFAEHAFRLSMMREPGSRKTPINKALFETVSVILAEIPKEEFDLLLSKKEQLAKRFSEYFNANELDVSYLISRYSQKESAVKERFKLFAELLDGRTL